LASLNEALEGEMATGGTKRMNAKPNAVNINRLETSLDFCSFFGVMEDRGRDGESIVQRDLIQATHIELAPKLADQSKVHREPSVS
jgi:hypothetical protein